MLFKSIALRAAGIALAVSLAANAGLWYAYRDALLDSQRIQTEVVAAANARLAESLSHQAIAHAEREAELLRRLELSDQVTREARARAEAAAASLNQFQRSQFANREDPAYADWADTKLPAGVAERLEALQ